MSGEIALASAVPSSYHIMRAEKIVLNTKISSKTPSRQGRDSGDRTLGIQDHLWGMGTAWTHGPVSVLRKVSSQAGTREVTPLRASDVAWTPGRR